MDHDAAFRGLYHAHAHALRRFAERFVRSADEAEDIVHDVFARIWQLRGRLEVGSAMRAYLYAATRAQALNHLAHAQVEARTRQTYLSLDASDHLTTLPSGPEESLAAGELTEALHRVLEIMPIRSSPAAPARSPTSSDSTPRSAASSIPL